MISEYRLNRQKDARYFVIFHRRMIKPPYPVMLPCPNCGHPWLEVNSNMIEIINSSGLQKRELTARDAWMRQKHLRCGAYIAFYWKD